MHGLGAQGPACDVPPETRALIIHEMDSVFMRSIPISHLPEELAQVTAELFTFPSPTSWLNEIPTAGSILENINLETPASANGLRRQATQLLTEALHLYDDPDQKPKPHVDDVEDMVAAYDEVMRMSPLAHLYSRNLLGPPVRSPLNPAVWWEGHQLHCSECRFRGPWEHARLHNEENLCYISSILAWLHNGWVPPFESLPPHFKEQNRPSLNKARLSARSELRKMQQEQVIYTVPKSDYVSALGVAVKSSALDELARQLHAWGDTELDHLLDGHDIDALNEALTKKYHDKVELIKARITWDLSTHVNPCLFDLPFSSPDLDSVLPTIMSAGDQPWLFKWDFKRCFHSIPLHPLTHQYFCCEHEGQLLQASRAIFGGKPHPYVANILTGETRRITQVAQVDPSASYLQRSSDILRTALYVDDNLGAGKDRNEGLARLSRVVAVVKLLGWEVPQDHIEGPAQVMPFRGIVFDPISQTMSVPPAKIARLGQSIALLLSQKQAPQARELRSLVGKCQWLASVMLEGRMHCQSIYDVIPHWKQNSVHVSIHSNDDVLQDLVWWRDTLAKVEKSSRSVWTTFSKGTAPVLSTIVSDAAAADQGFAAIIDEHVYVGQWVQEQVEGKSSAWRELVPILLAVQSRAPYLPGGTTLIVVTDSAAVAYALNKGSSPQADMRKLLCRIVQCAAEYHIQLVADWAPRQNIALLDALSKLDKVIPKHMWKCM